MATETGADLRAAGESRALQASPPEWREYFWSALATLIEAKTPFTSEDVVAIIGLPNKSVGTNRNNAVGAAMSSASKRGLIVKVGLASSKRPSSHGATLVLWAGK